jgi:transcriptional regulator with XRE-family HTH domain
MTFGKRLAALRKDARLTQKQLCAFLKMGDSAISSYEIGKSMPDHELLIEIAKYFNVSIDYLLGQTNEKIPLDREGYIKLPPFAGKEYKNELMRFMELLNIDYGRMQNHK